MFDPHDLAVPDELLEEASLKPEIPCPESGHFPKIRAVSKSPIDASDCAEEYPRQDSNLQPSASEADALSS